MGLVDEPKAARRKGGARKVVKITMIIIDTSKGLSKTQLAEPIPANTRPTSPRGIMPTPIAQRLIPGCPNAAQPVISLPTIATINLAIKENAI